MDSSDIVDGQISLEMLFPHWILWVGLFLNLWEWAVLILVLCRLIGRWSVLDGIAMDRYKLCTSLSLSSSLETRVLCVLCVASARIRRYAASRGLQCVLYFKFCKSFLVCILLMAIFSATHIVSKRMDLVGYKLENELSWQEVIHWVYQKTMNRQNHKSLYSLQTTYRAVTDKGLSTVDLGTDFEIAQIMIMLYHGCVLSNEDELKCWGKYSVSVYNVYIFCISVSFWSRWYICMNRIEFLGSIRIQW